MENKHKSNESSNSSATASSEINNSFQFMNLSFAGNSDSSVQVEPPTTHSLRPEQIQQSTVASVAHDYQMNMPAPFKILPGNLYDVSEEPSAENAAAAVEKTLAEIGFKATEIEGWEDMNQPPKQNLYVLLKNMIDNYIKPNVQIRIGDVSFNCHMMVLQCYSDFFMECSNEVIVQLPAERVTPQAFMMVYDWMLSAEPLVQREGILELFNAANFLKIKGLVDQCWVCLDDDIRFQEDTAFLLYLEARNYGLEMIQQLMLTRICKFFLTLVASKDFLLLSVKEVCTLLSSNSIGVNSELEILMAGVRWLNYDWNERQSEVLNVLSCVRFGLIRPWILVALRRDTDYICVERVVDNPQIKKMIDDGLSYTTTQLFYSRNVDNFLAYLERYNLTKPVQRQWICDQECSYHHKIDCPNRQYITYESFLEYLEMIRSSGKDYWKTLKMENQEGLHFQCCLPKASAANEQFIFHGLPKQSRDQAVQASGEDDEGGPVCRRGPTQTVDIKASWYQEIYSSNSRSSLGVRNSASVPPKSNNSHQDISTKEDNKNITLSHKSSSCCEVNQKAINIKKSILAKSYCCSTGSQEFELTMANSLTEAILQRPQNRVHDVPQMLRPMEKTLPLNPRPGDGKATGNERYTTVAAETKRITLNRKPCLRAELNSGLMNQKIFIFGGIDPYSRREKCDGDGNDVLYYDGCQNAWNYLVNMPGSRHHHSAVVFRNRIYVIGGTRPAVSCAMKAVNQKAINIKKSILAKSYCCSTGSQEFELTMANSLTEAILQRPQNRVHDVPQMLRPMEKTLPLNPRPGDGKATGNERYTTVAAETKRITLNRKPCLRAELNSGLMNQKIFIFGGIDPYSRREKCDGDGNDVLYYDGCQNAWNYLVNMPGSRHHHSAVVFRNRIYVIGGTRPAVSCAMKAVFETSVWSFDPKRLEWHNECHLPQPRRDFGLIAFDNDDAGDNKPAETGQEHCDGKRKNGSGLYIVGGESIDGTPLSSTLFYNVERKQWSKKAPLNLGRYGLAAAVVNKKHNAEIWIAGGVCGHEKDGVPMITDTVEFYGLGNDDAIWKVSLKRLRVPRLFARFCTVGGGKDLYIIGGISKNIQRPGEFSSISSVDFYNIQEERWVRLTDMIMSRHGHDVAVVNEKILIFGGVSTDERKTLKSVECFSTTTGHWLYHVACLPSPLSGLAAAVIDCDM